MICEPVNRCCPLCRESEGRSFHEDSRVYFRCPVCALVFVLPHEFVSVEEEKSVYDLHQNSADDAGYRHFLARLFDPLSQRLAPNRRGLDFGSGPGPTLSVMFEEAGHSMALYDPLYAPEIKLLTQRYDFIVASEVVEHLHRPGLELNRLWACLELSGWLGIMTKRVIDRAAFSRWHYKNDPTHVCFFSTQTFRWLADQWCATLIVPGKDVVLFSKTR